ncbi:hypothetical protein COO60DRAFT_282266 [Scenedesmus sp. NREL 46B-D3]|nr:hypothetical protein COO60DRAFT_282266 [Scenedesmus sp. NREL 46B-D3]
MSFEDFSRALLILAATGSSCSIYSDSSGRSSSNSSSSTADGEASCDTSRENACKVTRLKCLAGGLACPLLVVVTTPLCCQKHLYRRQLFQASGRHQQSVPFRWSSSSSLEATTHWPANDVHSDGGRHGGCGTQACTQACTLLQFCAGACCGRIQRKSCV